MRFINFAHELQVECLSAQFRKIYEMFYFVCTMRHKSKIICIFRIFSFETDSVPEIFLNYQVIQLRNKHMRGKIKIRYPITACGVFF